MNADWIKARIAEHDQMYQQSLATANAHSGAKQAYERMLVEIGTAPPAAATGGSGGEPSVTAVGGAGATDGLADQPA